MTGIHSMSESVFKQSLQGKTAPAEFVRVTSWPRLRTPWLALTGLLGVLTGVFVLSLVVGSVGIPLGDVLTVFLGGEPARATWTDIVLNFRLPKALTALLAGAALGVS